MRPSTFGLRCWRSYGSSPTRRWISQNRLCLLLVGQAELRRRIAMAVHEPLNQRIVVRHPLGGLGRDDLPTYLGHLLRLAGTELLHFDPTAIETLFHATN